MKNICRFPVALALLLCAALLIGQTSPAAGAEKKAGAVLTIKAGHPVATSMNQHKNWEIIKELVEKKSNGSIKIEVFPNSMLGSDNKMVQMAQEGIIQMASSSTSNMATFVKKCWAFDLPYMTQTMEESFKFFNPGNKIGGPIVKALDADFSKIGLKFAFGTMGMWRHFANTKREVRLPQDAKGLKVRVTGSPIERMDMEMIGANPVAMGWGEVYSALQQGTIDAQGNSFDGIYCAKHHEVIKYVSTTRHNSYSQIVVMNRKFSDGLTADQKKILDESIQEAMNKMREYWVPMVDEAEKGMKEYGVKVYNPSDTEMKAWKDAMKPVWVKFTPEIGADWIKTLQNAL